MKPAVILLSLTLLLGTTFAADESCVGQCGVFNLTNKCQCDSMCVYYESCCQDFGEICAKKVARGDGLDKAEDVNKNATSLLPKVAPTKLSRPTRPPKITPEPTPSADPEKELCSGQAFDAFLQLKNGRIYAFRGEYFYELDDESVLPGYPKVIKDVWGIAGPINAAFTRINCQGKSYIFKGDKYWRFDGFVMDDDYPRQISVGFDGIPNYIDAAFAVPAPSHRGKEKVYFFKGDQYYQYEFKNQPSHEECVKMSKASPSLLFTQYTNLYCDETSENLFTELFGSSFTSQNIGPRSISWDWVGIRSPVDAVMVGRVYIPPKPRSLSMNRQSRKTKRPSGRGHQRRQQSRYVFYDLWLSDDLFDFGEDYSTDYVTERPTMEYKATPIQNVYFFQKDKYYRVSLKTKRVDAVTPPYPRSIAKYWLGCEQETPDPTKAEKK